MANRQLVITVPEAVLLAEKTDEASFAQELRMLAAVKLYELGRLSSGRARAAPTRNICSGSETYGWQGSDGANLVSPPRIPRKPG